MTRPGRSPMDGRGARALSLALVALAAGLGTLATCGPAALAAEAPAPAPEAAASAGPSTGKDAPRDAEQKARPARTQASDGERGLARLRMLEASLRQQRDIPSAGRDMPSVLESIAAMQEAQRSLTPQQWTRRALESFRREWLLDERRLDVAETALLPALDALFAAREELQEMVFVWEATLAARRAEGAPAPLVAQAERLLTETRRVQGSVEKQFAPIFDLQGRIAEARLAIVDGLTWVDAALVREERGLLQLDAPPLWTALAEPSMKLDFSGAVGAVAASTLRALPSFLIVYRARILVHILSLVGIFAALLVVGRHMRTRTPAPGEEDAAGGARSILSRPMAATLLIGLVSVPWIYPRAPMAALEAALTLSVIPALGLLPRLVVPQGRRPMAVLFAFYVVDRARSALDPESLAARLAVLAMSLAGLAVVWWLLGPRSPLRGLAANRWRVATRVALRISGALMLVAVVVNVVGNVSLARLLVGGAILSGYLAAMSFLGVLVLRGLVAVALASGTARRLNAVERYGESLRRRLFLLADMAGLLGWVILSAGVFGARGRAFEGVKAALGARVSLGTISFSAGDVLAFVATLWLAVALTRVLRDFLEADILPRLQLPRGLPATITMMVRYGMLTAGFLLALAAAGVEIGKFSLLAGALGVGVGFGLQTIVHNFVSGLILMFERPIQVGDTIEVGPLLGRVRHIGVRASTIQTFDGAEVIVPNGSLVSNEVVNWTLSDRLRRLEVKVGVAYGSDPRQVIDLLLGAAREQPALLQDPAPQALFQGFGESSLDFVLRAWTDEFDNWPMVKSDLSLRVGDALRGAGIEIPFPQRDLHVRTLPGGLGSPGGPA